MSKRCLQRENVHPTADGMGRMGMAQLVRVQVDVHGLAPPPHPLGNRLTTQRTFLSV